MRPIVLVLALLLPGPAAASTIAVQPVRVCTADGCPSVTFDPVYLKRVWAQADVDIRIRKPRRSALLDIDRDAAGELDAMDALYDYAFWQMDHEVLPNTAYIGFTGPLSGRTIGMGFVNGPGLTLFPYGIAEDVGGRYGAAVVAHELGHVLGASHDSGVSLMAPTLRASDFADPDYLPTITPYVFDATDESPLLGETETLAMAPIPLPATASSLAGALALLAWAARRRHQQKPR